MDRDRRRRDVDRTNTSTPTPNTIPARRVMRILLTASLVRPAGLFGNYIVHSQAPFPLSRMILALRPLSRFCRLRFWQGGKPNLLSATASSAFVVRLHGRSLMRKGFVCRRRLPATPSMKLSRRCIIMTLHVAFVQAEGEFVNVAA